MRPSVAASGAAWPVEPPAEAPEHEAEDLTRGGREALIRFRGQVYTLRITRQGKLLLTK